jgi:hypothetical protein
MSLRDDFRQVTLRRVFCETLRGIDLLPHSRREEIPHTDRSSVRLPSCRICSLARRD